MIPSNEVHRLTHLHPRDIVLALAEGGYNGLSFETVRFVEVNDCAELVYRVWPFDDFGIGRVDSYLVVLTFNPITNSLSARVAGDL